MYYYRLTNKLTGFLSALLLQRKFPAAAAGFVRNVRVTADALAGDAVVNGPGELPVFHDPHGLAGMELLAVAFP